MTSENFHFTFKVHVVEEKTQVLLFLPMLRELSIFNFLIFKFRLFRVTNSSHKVAKAFYLYHLSLLSHFDKLDSFQRTPDWSKILQCKTKPCELFRNEKRSLSEGEANICQTRAGLFVFIVISQKRNLLYKTRRWRRFIGEIPSFLLAKQVVLLVTAFFTFICFLGLLFGRRQERKSTLTVVR